MPQSISAPDEKLLDVVWTLSSNGKIVGQYLHHPAESCAHSPEQTDAVLKQLSAMPRVDALDFREKLQQLRNAPRLLWGAGATCHLCDLLMLLANL